MQKNDQAPRRKRDPIVAPPLNWVAPAKPLVQKQETYPENDNETAHKLESV